MRNSFLAVILLLLTISSSAFSKEKGWTNLFNGKDLKGWEQVNGEAKYEVVDGMVVGTTVLNTPNSFLKTEKTYSDFIFEVDLFVEYNMNSGIQFRSICDPAIKNGRVHGYQCEVDPSQRAWSAGIYDEARRGWLYPVTLNLKAQSAFKLGDWNHYRIECIGNSIQTFLNGVPVAHLIDNLTPEGYIALQVHSIHDESQVGKQIKWKNARIKTKKLKPSYNPDVFVVNLLKNELSQAEEAQGWELLFDGQTTNGWKGAKSDQFPEQGWEVKNEQIIVLSDGGDRLKGGGDIVTTKEFEFFDLQFDFMLTEGSNSGIKYGLGNNGASTGLEYQLLDDQSHPDANNGVVGNRKMASLYDLIPSQKNKRFVKKPGEWNRGRLVVYPNNHVEHWLNGVKVVEYERGSATFDALVARSKYAKHENFGMSAKSPILLQDHHDEVHFRNLKIRRFNEMMDLPFKLGIASYSLRKFDLDQTLAMSNELKIDQVAFKNFHLPLDASDELIKTTLEKCNNAGVNLYGGGVIYMKTKEQVDQAFEYAKKANMKMIIGVPNHELLKYVEKNVKKYDIKLAIHNHGPGDKLYPSAESAYVLIKDMDPRMGLCIDIGHTARIGRSPSADLYDFFDRVFDIHIKDVTLLNKDGRTTEVGRGKIDIPGFLIDVKKSGYTGVVALEFEKNGGNPLPGMKESFKYIRGVLNTLTK